tara:strand:- start:34 stop:1242 length:1209 start_codon:yes stop_codon:yes gene_type:complete
MKKCCILGLGYIGLPTAAIISNAGHYVVGVDVREDIISSLNAGNTHFHEDGLDELISKGLKNKKFLATNSPKDSDVFIISVPTPSIEKNGLPQPDLSFVFNAVNSICDVLKKDDILIIESTIPLGTTDKIEAIIKTKTNLNRDLVHICYCPERVLPGNIIYELINNNRVIGGLTEKASNLAIKFYSTFCKGNLSKTNAITAEMVKLTENSFRDVNIAFANELSMICHNFEIDTERLIDLANLHPRVDILRPGCGVGGHCIAIDPWFIVSAAPKDSILIKTAREVNNKKPKWIIEKILEKTNELNKSFRDEIKVGIFGITFKPNVEDTRESPALNIALQIIKKKIKVQIAEPNLKSHDGLKIYDLNYVVENSNLLVFLVAHEEFKSLDLKNKIFLDFCGVSKK